MSTLKLRFEYPTLRKYYFDSLLIFLFFFALTFREKCIFLILALLFEMKLLTPEGMKIASLTLITKWTRQEELKNAQYFFSPLFPSI